MISSSSSSCTPEQAWRLCAPSACSWTIFHVHCDHPCDVIICGPPDWCDHPSDLTICGPLEWCDHPRDVITWPMGQTSYHEAVREKGDARDMVAQIKQGDHATWMGDHSTCFSEIRYGRANQTRRSRHMGDHSTCFNDIRDGSAN